MKIHVALFKTVGTYFSTKKNKDVPVTNLFLRVNAGALIPVDVKYFKLPSCDGRDPSYQARFAKLEALAGLLQKGDELPREIVSVPGQLVVEIYKKEGKYTDKEGKEVPFVDLYLKINENDAIPISVKYFANDKFDGRDPGYASRIALLSCIAYPLPDKPKESVTPSSSLMPSAQEMEDLSGEELPL